MAPCHRLRGLKMGEARHHPIGPGLGLREKCLLQRGQPLDGRIALVANPEPEIGRHLVVPRPRRVKPPGGRADHLLQPRLHIHVDVFERARKGEVSALDL